MQSAPTLLGQPPWWQRAAADVRSSLRRASAGLPAEVRGLLPGLVDGDTTDLDLVLAERFRLAGLSHLVAVSGTNCSILIGAILLAMRRFGARPWLSASLAALVLVGFVVIARPSPSVLRAAAMSAIGLAALATGRPKQALPALSAAVLGLLLWDPTLSTDAGFAMSALATAALLVIAPGWADALRRRRMPPVLSEAVAVGAAAHLVTAPVIVAISGRLSLVAIPANVLAEPVVAAATVLGFVAAVTSPFTVAVGAMFAQLAGWPCRWLVWVADYFGNLHGVTVPWPSGVPGALTLLVLSAAVVALAVRTRLRRLLAVGALVAVIVQIPVRSAVLSGPPPGWMFVACDVGQGDALVLAAGGDRAVVIDAGPDPVAVDRCLHDLGVGDVALLILTHFHLDHVAGITGVIRGRRLGAVLTSPLADPVSGVWIVRDALAARGVTMQTARPSAGIDVGQVHLDVLAPTAAFRDTRSDPNNSSVVVRATISGERILLPGDVELEAQQAMLADHVDLRADVLKVPHHGSAYSSPAFLSAVHARVAVISVGLNNDYGHPSPVLLDEMARLGVPVRRTDHDGDVAVVADGGALRTVVRGTRSSTVGLRAGQGGVPSRLSVGDATMALCPPGRCRSTTSPISRPGASCSSATRSCASAGPSARSPPPNVRRAGRPPDSASRSTVVDGFGPRGADRARSAWTGAR